MAASAEETSHVREGRFEEYRLEHSESLRVLSPSGRVGMVAAVLHDDEVPA
jgi:hypothetical protein